jgi:hypothetical protein
MNRNSAGIPVNTDWGMVGLLCVAVALILGLVAWDIFYVTADCSSLTWLPVTSTPTRCLKGMLP